jgi:signal transduction histidine kinase
MLVEDFYEFSDDEKISYLKEMQKTSKSSYELLDNLLQWSRSQTSRVKYSPSKISLYNAVAENYDLLKKSADIKNIELKSNIDKKVTLIADEDMVTTILRNLITNAIKFTPKEGRITISAKEVENNFVQISVSDTGIGIEPERIEKIFRIDSANSTEGTEGEKGSGLGLILSKEFVEKHGGKIWVESQVNAGTTFHFTLPKA